MKEAVEKASVLIEALPYIIAYQGRIVVIKYGGSAMQNENFRESIIQDIVFMKSVGMEPVVVHGGGKAISEEMKKKGITPHFVDGLRLTDSQSISIVENVLVEANGQIVEHISKLGAKPVGLNGKEFIRAKKKYHEKCNPQTQRIDKIDIGFVGEVEKVEIRALTSYIETGYVPVVSPLGLGEDGKVYNINADSVSAEVATALNAEKLVLLTDVKGIMRDPNLEESLIPTLKVTDIQNLIEEGIITGGMIPKVRACERALQGGVRKTHMVSGRISHSLLLEIFTEEGTGTEITK